MTKYVVGDKIRNNSYKEEIEILYVPEEKLSEAEQQYFCKIVEFDNQFSYYCCMSERHIEEECN